MSSVISASIFGVLVCVRIDKNNQLCDIQPRIGTIHSDFQGRPIEVCKYELVERLHNEIEDMEEEKVDSFILGNKERAQQFKILLK